MVQVLDLAADVLKKVPEEIDYEQTAKIMADDPSPLNVVLLQEVRPFSIWYLKIVLKQNLETIKAKTSTFHG